MMAGKPLSFILPSYFLLRPFHLQILMMFPRMHMLEVTSRSQPQRLANADCRVSAEAQRVVTRQRFFLHFIPLKMCIAEISHIFCDFPRRPRTLPNANAATSHHHQPRKPVSVTGQISQHSSFASGLALSLKSSGHFIKPAYTKTEHITVTKTDPSLLIFGGGNFQMKWAKKQVSDTFTHFHHIFIKM